MLPKPESCQGCPFYSDGLGFTPDEHIDGATTLILGQNPGAVEERSGVPFSGPTGQLQTEHFFSMARLERGKNVHIANLLKCRWTVDGKKTDVLPTGKVLEQAIEHCTTNHLRIPEGTNLIVAEGGHAASWCGGRHVSVWNWRGHVLHPTRPELPTVYIVEHLASVMRDPRMFWVAELDWRKIPRILSRTWPLTIPKRIIATPDTWNETIEWFTKAKREAPYIAIDTEFLGKPFGKEQPLLTVIGVGYPTLRGQITGIQLDCRGAENWMRASFYHQLHELIKVCPVLVQNFAADLPVLKRRAGIPYTAYKQVNDTMLAHAIMYCELPHDLGFLTSLYGMFIKLKHLGDYNMTPAEGQAALQWLLEHEKVARIEGDTPDLLYNWGDVIETISAWEHLAKALDMDSRACSVYENQSIKLIPTLLRSMEHGIRVNQPRVLSAKAEYEQRCVDAQAIAEAYYGRGINLGSDDQIKYYCYREMGYPQQINRETKRSTVDEDAVAILRDHVGPVVDTRLSLTMDLALLRIEQGADPILEARVLYSEAEHALSSYINPLLNKDGSVKERVYPNFAIHAQKTGRWSTTEPPLAQLPDDLRDLIIPDEGECWIHWDWKGIELHLLEVHSGSRILKQAHDDGVDLHTWTACKMFKYELPPDLRDPNKSEACASWRIQYQWKGSSDPRRVFSKSARYEMNYGGTGATAAEKAIRMGLNPKDVKLALANLLTADVDYYRWRQSIEKEVRQSRMVRTFTGRPRRFLTVSRDHSMVVPAKVVREALDYPMQAGVADVFNTTVVEIAKQYPQLRFAWSMHDSLYWSTPLTEDVQAMADNLKAIAMTEYTIEGRKKRFPLDMDIIYPPEYQGGASAAVHETV